jgi:hypothetical protein
MTDSTKNGQQDPRPEDAADSTSVNGRKRRNRLAVLVVLAVLAIALAVTGGLTYLDGGSSKKPAVEVASAVSPAAGSEETSAGDQYRISFAWGDPKQNNAKAPGLARLDRDALSVVRSGEIARVSARVALNEQADLRLSVYPRGGTVALQLQQGSTVDKWTSVRPTESIRYRMLIPRAFRPSLAIPESSLKKGSMYEIRIQATDPSSKQTMLVIPFRA